jgi:transporter family protein
MKLWIVYALLTTGFWGLWGFFGKMATRTVTSQTLLLLASLGCIAALLLCIGIYVKSSSVSLNNPDHLYGFLSGFALIIGLLFFYRALAHGEATRVVIITATYPLVTLILAYLFLKEPVTFQKALGVILALSGIFFLSL